ncbi:LytS/YhcK type 5TM receptor domain-containing protein [Paenibacillus cremeus]|uniref:Signal transduction histidine kinase 5TM receptor LytS transmembrane region domain-containing protein n=1 Tax=Paenibacillus cremeus TaxID=2163881 RepID=A0A559K485_9BACL|nr:hypothetical protein FPZ49_26295 [Paenibacillus cremeus]
MIQQIGLGLLFGTGAALFVPLLVQWNDSMIVHINHVVVAVAGALGGSIPSLTAALLSTGCGLLLSNGVEMMPATEATGTAALFGTLFYYWRKRTNRRRGTCPL